MAWQVILPTGCRKQPIGKGFDPEPFTDASRLSSKQERHLPLTLGQVRGGFSSRRKVFPAQEGPGFLPRPTPTLTPNQKRANLMANQYAINLILEKYGIKPPFKVIDQFRVQVTPELAEALLATSPGNRGLRATKVAEFKAALLAGDWKENGDSIRIDEKGNLIDGHHRLECCIAAGVSFYTFIVTGVPCDAAKTIDKGSQRSNKDELTMHRGFTPADAGIVAGMARNVITHDMGFESWVRPPGNSSKYLYTEKLFEWVDSNLDQVAMAVEFSKEVIMRGNLMLPKSSVAALHFLSARQDKNAAESFMRQVFLGHNVTPKSTQDNLRTILLQAAMKTRKMTSRTAFLTAAKCLRSHLAGRKITSVGNAVFYDNRDNVPFFKS